MQTVEERVVNLEEGEEEEEESKGLGFVGLGEVVGISEEWEGNRR